MLLFFPQRLSVVQAAGWSEVPVATIIIIRLLFCLFVCLFVPCVMDVGKEWGDRRHWDKPYSVQQHPLHLEFRMRRRMSAENYRNREKLFWLLPLALDDKDQRKRNWSETSCPLSNVLPFLCIHRHPMILVLGNFPSCRVQWRRR